MPWAEMFCLVGRSFGDRGLKPGPSLCPVVVGHPESPLHRGDLHRFIPDAPWDWKICRETASGVVPGGSDSGAAELFQSHEVYALGFQDHLKNG